MTLSDRFMQLSAETHGAQFQAIILAVICAVAAFVARTETTNETKKQYGQGLTLATAKIWWRRFFTIYFLPSVFLTELFLQIFTRSKLYEWLTMSMATTKTIYITDLSFSYGVFALSTPLLYSWIRGFRRLSKLNPEPLPSETIDMSKWAQDESGQWFRVTYRKGDDVIYDPTKPYAKRAVEWIETKRVFKRYGWGALLCAIVCLILYFLMPDERAPHNPDSGALILVFYFVGFMGVFFCIGLLGISPVLSRGRENFVGPASSSAGGRGVEQVEKQKVYGEGGFATPEEIHQAAHGHSAAQAGAVGDADEIEFDD